MDDLSIAAKVKLNSDIVTDTSRERPLTFDQMQELKVSDSANTLQIMMDDLLEFANQRQMIINAKKTCVMKICKSRTISYPTEIKVGANLLEVKSEMKILGVMGSKLCFYVQKSIQEYLGY